MNNLFDELNGIHLDDDDPQMDGLFSSIKKRLKKTVRSVKKITSKVSRKVLPSSIRRIGRKIDKAGIGKIAAGAALLMVGVPAVAAGLKGTKLASIASSGFKAVKGIKTVKLASGASSLISAGAAARSALTQGAQMGPQTTQQILAERQGNSFAAIEVAKAIGQSPKFAEAVKQFRAQGYSDTAILEHWIQSKSFYLAAVPKVAQTIYPEVRQQVEQAGYSGRTARELAYAESYRVADQETKKVQASAGTNMTPILLTGALALLLKG